MTIRMTYEQAFDGWKADIMPEVIKQYGSDDYPALSESWNDYTDGLCKDGKFNDLQYHYCPAWDDEMPDDDRAFILDAMGVKFSAVHVISRPDGLMDDMPAGSTHWRVMIQRSGAELVTHYSMGPAHTDAPELPGVLWSLLMDTDGLEYSDTFEEWASNLGYDEDSRKAEKIYKACQETQSRLALLFESSELSDLRELFEDF